MSFTEGIALAGIILSIFLAYLNHRTGKDARDSAERQSRETREATAAEARAARLFDARRAVYVDAMEYAFLIETFVDRTEPMMTWEGMPGPPEFPPEPEQRLQSAQVAAFGSKAVRDKLADLRRAAQRFQGAVWVMRGEREHDPHSDAQIRAYREVGEQRDAVKALVEELLELVNGELTR